MILLSSDCFRVWRLRPLLCFWFSNLGTYALTVAFQEKASLRILLLLLRVAPLRRGFSFAGRFSWLQ
jgi:hypothetical protein